MLEGGGASAGARLSRTNFATWPSASSSCSSAALRRLDSAWNATAVQPSMTLSQLLMFSRVGGCSLNSSSIAGQFSTSSRRSSVRSSVTLEA